MWFRRPSSLAILGSVLVLGALLIGARPSSLRADGTASVAPGPAVGSGCQVASGPIAMLPDANKNYYPIEAVYYLDYGGGRLLAGIPSGMSSVREGAAANAERITTEFAERDLAADFQIPRNVAPRFLMTVARMSLANGGWAPLYVFEAATGQVATYKVVPEMVGTANRTKILLVERKSLAKSALPPVGP